MQLQMPNWQFTPREFSNVQNLIPRPEIIEIVIWSKFQLKLYLKLKLYFCFFWRKKYAKIPTSGKTWLVKSINILHLRAKKTHEYLSLQKINDTKAKLFSCNMHMNRLKVCIAWKKGAKIDSFNLIWPLSDMISIWYRDKKLLRSLNKPRRRRQQERHKTKGLISKIIAVHVRYKSLYISMPSSA